MPTVRRLAAHVAAVTLAFTPLGLGAASASPDGPAGAERTSAGTAIVGLDSPALAAGLLRGFAVERVSQEGSFAVVRTDDLRPLRDALRGVPGVRYVEDNPLMYALATPNDPRYAEQYGPPMMGFPAAWNTTFGSSTIKVAVIDSGFRRTHQDFTPGSRFLAGWDYYAGDGTPEDPCGHGTHVIGTVAASTNNSLGVAGMAGVTILPLRVLGPPDILGQCSGSHANIAQAIIDAANQGAKVISMSIGGSSGSTALQNAVDYAAGQGVVIVAAAGNGGSSNGVDYPGAYANVTAVAALTSAKVRASYSDAGPQVDIAAPGSNVLSSGGTSDTSYVQMSGTSMATPHVAGAVGLALSCAPATSRATMLSTLYSTAEDLGAVGFDNIYGNGLARADRMVTNLCGGGGGTNNPPTASFTHSETGLTVNVNGSGSSDPNGDALTYSWTFGDGGTATGVTASRTYAAQGTYTVTLTVNDGRGGTHSTSQSVTVPPADPDPGAPTIANGTATSVTFTAAGQEKFYKINVPAGRSQLQVVMTGPACGLLGCSFDADLYTRYNARPTATLYDCRPFASGNGETCTHASPATGWWYIRVHAYAGFGTVTVTPTYS